jgi:endonuclease-3
MTQDTSATPEDRLAARRARYRAIAPLLRETYGTPEWDNRLAPVDELVSTILSQNTNDTNRDHAFNRLRERFDDWAAVRDAPTDAVIDAIRPAGLANQKGPRIQNALRHITETQGTISLDHLQDMPLGDAKAWLTNIKGVGPKTAAIVLLFAFRRPVFPVDTHVHRVSKRLDLIDANTSAERAHDALEAIVPEDDYYVFHLNMITHGRECCHARRAPECERCPLTAYCAYFRETHTEP